MPRAFSDDERRRLRRALLRVAREHFTRHGYRKATVAEIAGDAGIGKGSVYLFYPSKAELFMAVATEVERELRERLLAELEGFDGPAREHLREFFRLQHEMLREHPLLRVAADPAEAAALLRELPPSAVAEHLEADDRFFAELVARWRREGKVGSVEPHLVGALGRALFALGLHRQLVGEKVYPEVVDLLIRGLGTVLAPDDGGSS